MATIYGISDLSTYTSAVEKFIENTKPVAAGIGFQGAIFGPVIEDIAKDGENVKGSAFKLCIGWTSIEAHMRFRETDAFKKNIHLLREGSTGAALVNIFPFSEMNAKICSTIPHSRSTRCTKMCGREAAPTENKLRSNSDGRLMQKD